MPLRERNRSRIKLKKGRTTCRLSCQ